MGINSFFGRNGNEKGKKNPIHFDHQITSKKHYFRAVKTQKFFDDLKCFRLEQPRGGRPRSIKAKYWQETIFGLCFFRFFVFWLTKKNGKKNGKKN